MESYAVADLEMRYSFGDGGEETEWCSTDDAGSLNSDLSKFVSLCILGAVGGCERRGEGLVEGEG